MIEALISLIPGGWIAAAGAGLLALLAAIWRAFAAGKASERARQDRARLESITDAQRIDDAIAGRDPDANRKELGRWNR